MKRSIREQLLLPFNDLPAPKPKPLVECKPYKPPEPVHTIDYQIPLPFDNPPKSLPHTPGSDTSESAAFVAGHKVTQNQQVVLNWFREHEPATFEEAHTAFTQDGNRMSVSGFRTRVSELVKVGLMEDTRLRRLTTCGNPAVVWRATPK